MEQGVAGDSFECVCFVLAYLGTRGHRWDSEAQDTIFRLSEVMMMSLKNSRRDDSAALYPSLTPIWRHGADGDTYSRTFYHAASH